MSRGERKAMIAPGHRGLSVSRQCRLLSISRSSFYYAPRAESPENLALMRRIDELFLKYPFFGSRQMVRQLRREGVRVGRHRVRRLMRLMGLEAIYQAPRTSVPHPAHRVYPYLLRDLTITRPDHVWCADITSYGQKIHLKRPAPSRRFAMVIAQEPAQSLAALHVPTTNVRIPREQQDIALPLVISLSVEMLEIFAQHPPQRALTEKNELGQALLLHLDRTQRSA